MALEIAKAGWLHRLSSVLKRWKKRWFVLYQNGELRCFENQDSYEAEGIIIVRAHVVCIQTGSSIKDVSPPDGRSADCLLCLKFRDKEMVLCAENSDDMKAWQIGIEDARVLPQNQGQNQPPAYTAANGMPYPAQQGPYPVQVQSISTGYQPPVYVDNSYYTYGGYPGQVIQPGNTPYVVPGAGCSGSSVVVPAGTNTVIVQDGYRRRYCGNDMAYGMLAGAAIGSMMWTPFLFW